jgi:TonB family protein
MNVSTSIARAGGRIVAAVSLVHLLALLLVLTLTAPRAVVAQPADGARELTPARVALLVEAPDAEATQKTLAEALASPQPFVRRVASRVARVTRSTRLLPALERAHALEAPATLTGAEMAHAIASLRGERPEGEGPSARPRIEAVPFNVKPRLRLWPPVTPALVRDLQRLTGCQLSDKAPFILAHIDYQPTGIVNHVGLEGDALSEPCRRLGGVMAALTIASPGRPIEPGEKELVVLAFVDDYLDCLQSDARNSRDIETIPVRVAGSGMNPPARASFVLPAYPKALREQRIQGVEMVEATISARGCVQQLEVVRSVHPSLDFAALYAVMSWRYHPGRFDGKPVPAIMTILVDFPIQ